MSAQRPEIEEGYLGPQQPIGDAKMSPASHQKLEFVILENDVVIKFNVPEPIKCTANLIQCSSDKDMSEYVFIQNDDKEPNVMNFHVNVPETGFYKVQIFALPKSNESKSLPNVFNYLINCKNAMRTIFPFPKQFAIWKEGCHLYEPFMLDPSRRLSQTVFKVLVPKANAVAAVIDGEWFHFDKKDGNIFTTKINLENWKGKGTKLTINGNFEADEKKYATLLEYKF